MKRTTIELYGINPIELADMPYRDALIACKQGAKNRLYELMQVSYLERDEKLIYDVNKAFDWCDAKLRELGEE